MLRKSDYRIDAELFSYHYPGVTNNLYISPATFEKLAAHPNIVGTKLSHGIIDDQALIAASPRIDHDYFYVFTGLGQNLLPVSYAIDVLLNSLLIWSSLPGLGHWWSCSN